MGGSSRVPYEVEKMIIDAGLEGGLTKIRELASRLDDHHWLRGAWVSDTANDPFLSAQIVLSQKLKEKVGTNVAVALARSPFCLAQTSYNLQQLAEGRFILGLGTQVKAHIERRFSMAWPSRPVAALKEYVALLRELYRCFSAEERPNFQGEFYQCTLATPVFTPEPHAFGPPPIGFSAVGPQMTRAAGQVADYVFLHPFTHPKYLQEITLPALAQGIRERSTELAPLQVVGLAFCLPSDLVGAEEYRVQVLSRLAFYASTPAYSTVLASLGLEDLHNELHRLSRHGEWAKMSAMLPSILIEACTVSAPLDQIPDALEKRFGAYYDRVVIDPTPFL